MATHPATEEKSLPAQIPTTAPAGPAGQTAPAADPGSKARDVPK
jgi:hypothetical protein